MEKPRPVNGQWGSWGDYSNCSRPCGGGIKYAARDCNNPKPSYNGDYCLGARRKYKSCNTNPCSKTEISFRAKQCSSFNGKNLGIPGVPAHVVWIPKYSSSLRDACKLYCEIEGYGVFYQLASKVIDGTKCQKGSDNVCVDGRCRVSVC